MSENDSQQAQMQANESLAAPISSSQSSASTSSVKPKSKKKMSIALISVLVLCAVAGISYYLYASSKDSITSKKAAQHSVVPTSIAQVLSPVIASSPIPTIEASVATSTDELFGSAMTRFKLVDASFTLKEKNTTDTLPVTTFAPSWLDRFIKPVVAADEVKMFAYGAYSPFGFDTGTNTYRATKADLISLAAKYGFSEQDIIEEPSYPSGYVELYFAKNGRQLNLPGFALTSGEYKLRNSQPFASTTLTKDEQLSSVDIIRKARTYVEDAGIEPQLFDWEHAKSITYTLESTKTVTVPLSAGEYRTITSNQASDLTINFDLRHTGYNISIGNDSLYLKYLNAGQYPVISLDDAKNIAVHEGGYMSCMEPTGDYSLSGERGWTLDRLDSWCSHIDDIKVLETYKGALSDITISSAEMVYAQIRVNEQTRGHLDYVSVPAYLFKGTATPTFDLSITVNGPGGATNEAAARRNGKENYIYIMVPAINSINLP